MLLHRGCSEERKAAFCWSGRIRQKALILAYLPPHVLLLIFMSYSSKDPQLTEAQSPLIFQDPPYFEGSPSFLFLAHKKLEFMPFLNTGMGGTKWTQVRRSLKKTSYLQPLAHYFLVKWQIILQSLAISWEATSLLPNSLAPMILHGRQSHMLNNIPL